MIKEKTKKMTATYENKEENKRIYNISSFFLLPGLKVNGELRKKFNDNGFVNTYVKCKGCEYPFPVVYLLFKPDILDISFIKFIEKLQANPNFIDVIDLVNGKVMVVYKIPNKFTEDYKLFLKGKYSRMSDEFKNSFAMEKIVLGENGRPLIRGGKYVREKTNYFHIFNRTEHMKKHIIERCGVDEEILENLEYYDRPNLKEERLLEPGMSW